MGSGQAGKSSRGRFSTLVGAHVREHLDRQRKRKKPASGSKAAHVHVAETKRFEETDNNCLFLVLLNGSKSTHLSWRRIWRNRDGLDPLLGGLLEEEGRHGVERLHHHRSWWQRCCQLLCLALLVLATLACSVAAVDHHAGLGQVLQGEGEDDMGRHSKDHKCLPEAILEAKLTQAGSSRSNYMRHTTT